MTCLIAISGPPGGGKSTFAKDLVFDEKVEIVEISSPLRAIFEEFHVENPSRSDLIELGNCIKHAGTSFDALRILKQALEVANAEGHLIVVGVGTPVEAIFLENYAMDALQKDFLHIAITTYAKDPLPAQGDFFKHDSRVNISYMADFVNPPAEYVRGYVE